MTKASVAHNSLLNCLKGPCSNNSTTQVLSYDRILLIGGDIGIAPLVPFINSH